MPHSKAHDSDVLQLDILQTYNENVTNLFIIGCGLMITLVLFLFICCCVLIYSRMLTVHYFQSSEFFNKGRGFGDGFGVGESNSWYLLQRNHVLDAHSDFAERLYLRNGAVDEKGLQHAMEQKFHLGLGKDKDDGGYRSIVAEGIGLFDNEETVRAYGIAHALAQDNYRDNLGRILHRPIH